MAHKEFHDLEAARRDARRLAAAGRIDVQDSGHQLPHLIHRQRALSKDPSLSIAEIRTAIEHPGEFAYAVEGQFDFFRVQTVLDAREWQGLGRVLFRIEEGHTEAVLVVTAYRVRDRWRAKGVSRP